MANKLSDNITLAGLELYLISRLSDPFRAGQWCIFSTFRVTRSQRAFSVDAAVNILTFVLVVMP